MLVGVADEWMFRGLLVQGAVRLLDGSYLMARLTIPLSRLDPTCEMHECCGIAVTEGR
jgi:phage gp36-like protein